MAIILHTDEPLHWAKGVYWRELEECQYEIVPLTLHDMLRLLSQYDSLRVETNSEHLSIHAIRHSARLTPRGKE